MDKKTQVKLLKDKKTVKTLDEQIKLVNKFPPKTAIVHRDREYEWRTAS